MKIAYPFFLMCLLPAVGFAQPAAITHTVELSGNYVEDTRDKNKQHILDLNISFGEAISPNFIAGVAFSFKHEKVNTFDEVFIPGGTERPTIISYNMSEMIDRSYKPSVFLSYYHHVIKGLFFSSRLDIHAGFGQNNNEGIFAQFSNDPSDLVYPIPNNTDFVHSYATSKDYTYFGFSIQPQLTYYFGNHVGILLKMGAIRYDNYKGEYHNWIIGFNPEQWSYGFTFLFGK